MKLPLLSSEVRISKRKILMKKTEKKHAFDQEKSKIKKKENKRSIKKKRKKTRLRPGKKVRNQDLVHVKKKRKF